MDRAKGKYNKNTCVTIKKYKKATNNNKKRGIYKIKHASAGVEQTQKEVDVFYVSFLVIITERYRQVAF